MGNLLFIMKLYETDDGQHITCKGSMVIREVKS